VDELGDSIANANNENRHDRPKDAISLILQVLAAQHRVIVKLGERVGAMERELARIREPW
jgi:hypothetical protein